MYFQSQYLNSLASSSHVTYLNNLEFFFKDWVMEKTEKEMKVAPNLIPLDLFSRIADWYFY